MELCHWGSVLGNVSWSWRELIAVSIYYTSKNILTHCFCSLSLVQGASFEDLKALLGATCIFYLIGALGNLSNLVSSLLFLVHLDVHELTLIAAI